MRTLTIRVINPTDALAELKNGVKQAWKGDYVGEYLDFESSANLFQVFTPKRWQIVETLQASGCTSIRGLARLLKRDVHRVHDDVKVLLQEGVIEQNEQGVLVPFDEIQAAFTLRAKVA